ncbi:protein MKS1-like [Curcuma longa]|uniref:protein MKS1-like n=1 Tax=Curcuma longa TaxID=136217 RepID=UPI003D9F139F
MDNSGAGAGAGQQFARPRELHGPRPAPLTVRKESRKIRKPPVAPPPLPQQQQYRQPVIIYAVSPKVIHTTPADFMAVVQSLTGVHSAAAASSSSSLSGSATAGNPHGIRGSAQFSPAARLAAFEKTAATSSPSGSASARILNRGVVDDVVVEIIRSPEERRLGGGGILSPGPASLPWISPGMFTPTALFTPPPSIQLVASPDANNLIFSSSGMVPSPAAYWDLFNHYQH